MNQSSRPAGGHVRGQAPAPAPTSTSPGILQLDAFCGTHPGLARGHNEDAIRGTPRDYPPAKERGFLFIVADGMGGHNAGEVASNEAAQRVYQRYYAETEPDIHRCLEAGIRSANAELYAQAQADPEQQGMGTTMTAAVVKGNHLYVAHVGDSRLYLLRNGVLEQVTVDHSWVEEQVRAGVLTRSQADNHPQRNVITRALATTPDVQVDHFDRDLVSGDVILLNSDGLTTEVGEAQIAAIITQAPSARAAGQALIQRAIENGGRDNVSVAVLRVAFGPAAAASIAALLWGRRTWLLAGIAAALLVVLAGVVAFVAFRSDNPPPATASVAQATSQTPVQMAAPTAASGSAPLVVANPAGGASPVVTDPAAAPIGNRAPTATLELTPTPAPSMTQAPKPSPSSTLTRQAEAPLILAPVLKKPVGTVSEPLVQFEWEPPIGYQLKPDEAYALVYWRKDTVAAKDLLDRPTFYDACLGVVRKPSYPANADAAKLSGSYLWTVVVVDIARKLPGEKCAVVSKQPEPMEFQYSLSGGGGDPKNPFLTDG